MSAALADSNLLIALTVQDHVHHRRSRAWFDSHTGQLATCPITQGALLRFLVREGVSARNAPGALQQVQSLPQHAFWADEIGFDSTVLAGVIGHRQVTDAYLAALARHRNGRLATLDRGLAALHPRHAELIPT
ncbi:TA system VapC family ribonuclease toxin [Candidatus Poriferisodalis sp.]|uniref:TA system VapC family ribonuclease toxin n=1 Tax=Candidatus Poriferisodalis sp. TaxID=3101277 RepID=UPI003B010822